LPRHRTLWTGRESLWSLSEIASSWGSLIGPFPTPGPWPLATDDGSYGRKGFVSHALADVLAANRDVREVVAIGPLPMMKACCEVTRPSGIPTIVSLNSIMVDGTGMCGSCRVTVDGADFDGHLVNFDELALRQKRFEHEEKAALAPRSRRRVCTSGFRWASPIRISSTRCNSPAWCHSISPPAGLSGLGRTPATGSPAPLAAGGSLAKSIIVNKMSLRAGGIARISLVALFLCALVFAQTASLASEHWHHHSSHHCCLLCHSGPMPLLQSTVTAAAFAPVLRLGWLERFSGSDAPREVLLTAGDSRAPPA
jgi:hypothetical protein